MCFACIEGPVPYFGQVFFICVGNFEVQVIFPLKKHKRVHIFWVGKGISSVCEQF